MLLDLLECVPIFLAGALLVDGEETRVDVTPGIELVLFILNEGNVLMREVVVDGELSYELPSLSVTLVFECGVVVVLGVLLGTH